jgi:hypothetical protein
MEYTYIPESLSCCLNTFKYCVSCTDWKISVRSNVFLVPIFPLLSHSIVVFFFPVGLLFLSQHSQPVFLGVEVSSVSWLGQLTVNKKPTGKKNTTIEWDDDGKIVNKNK